MNNLTDCQVSRRLAANKPLKTDEMTEANYDNCKEAQLHDIFEIQSFGALIAVDKRTQCITACSKNINAFLEDQPDKVLGKHWSDYLTPNMVSTLFLQSKDAPQMSRVAEASLVGGTVQVSNHISGNHCIIELERDKGAGDQLNFNQRMLFLQSLTKTSAAEEAAKILAQEVAALIQFDRVMLYRFLPDWHGEVIDEVLNPGVEGFLGLRFPEGDIPANARRLFTINLQRLIADVGQVTIPIVQAPETTPLDMSYSQLRAVHPVHLKYMENMGVKASFSLSIVCEGKLWGLIACHNLSPKALSLNERRACEELTRITAMHMTDSLRAKLEQARYESRVAISEIRGAINSQRKGYNAINHQITNIKSLFSADGIWHHFEGQSYFSGNVPDQNSLTQLENWLAQLDRNSITAQNKLPDALAPYPGLTKYASGLLFLPLNKDDFILLFRHEYIEQVQWAGKPQTIDAAEGSLPTLTPRTSFLRWSQEFRGQSIPWSDLDIESAERFRQEIIDYIDRSEIEEMALKDPLTGLANRLCFEKKLNAAILNAIESDGLFAIYMIDLDNFKTVNDTLGHPAGDELLRQVSQRLQALTREHDTVARLGGDEFAIILADIKDTEIVELIATRLLDEMKRTFDVQGSQVQIGSSVGVSLCPLDASNQEELIHHADIALYEVKKSGRNGFKLFDSSMLSEQEHCESTRGLIRDGFDNNHFSLVYQPIIDARTDQVAGFAALPIWKHPKKGVLKASEFIEQVEFYQFGSEWAEWSFRQLFSKFQQWQGSGLSLKPVTLNISAKQFLQLDIRGLCQGLSEEYQINSSWLRIDLDEQALIISERRVEEKINELNEIGVLVNIDHFGLGFLSLKQLTKLKINQLKISGSSIYTGSNNVSNEAQFLILNSISQVLKTPIIVTETDNQEIIKHAREFGLYLFQGNVYGQPLCADEVTEWLAQECQAEPRLSAFEQQDQQGAGGPSED